MPNIKNVLIHSFRYLKCTKEIFVKMFCITDYLSLLLRLKSKY